MHLAKSAASVFFVVVFPAIAWPQATIPDKQNPPSSGQQSQNCGNPGAATNKSCADAQAKPQTAGTTQAPPLPADNQKKDEPVGEQTKRIFWVVPNFAAVNANTQLPPLSVGGKFNLALHDSVDYSSFIWAGILAGQNMALNADPELHHGIAGYGRYYWRAFADQASGAFFTEAIVPTIMHEDPRYYTLGQGSFLRRTGYALSQVVITKKDSGRKGFNFSEIMGNGMVAGLANVYYPPQERGLQKTAENWAEGLEAAVLNNIVKEFWPDIRKKLFRQK